MLSKENYEILSKISDEPKLLQSDPTDREQYLLDSGLLSLDSRNGRFVDIQMVFDDYLIVTPAGSDAVQEYEEEQTNRMSKEKERKREVIFQIFLVFLGSFLTLVVEHFPEIIGFIKDFFQSKT